MNAMQEPPDLRSSIEARVTALHAEMVERSPGRFGWYHLHFLRLAGVLVCSKRRQQERLWREAQKCGGYGLRRIVAMRGPEAPLLYVEFEPSGDTVLASGRWDRPAGKRLRSAMLSAHSDVCRAERQRWKAQAAEHRAWINQSR